MARIENIAQLCRKIELADEMTDRVLEFEELEDGWERKELLEKMLSPDTWEEGRLELKKQLGSDPDGSRILACNLENALKTWNRLDEAGIPDDILTETMKAYSRFVEEYKVSYGSYGFDRDFWTMRQSSGYLFRIGELEYEMTEISEEAYRQIPGDKPAPAKGCRVISLHIPSGSDISFQTLDKSIRRATVFFETFFPDYKDVPYICDTWLLYPKLQEMLPAYSKIILFQKLFNIYAVKDDTWDYKEWVFKDRDIDVKDAPEDTSLQRTMKSYVLDGGTMGVGFGRLIMSF